MEQNYGMSNKNIGFAYENQGFSYSLRLNHAAVDRAVDLARTLLSGAQGLGPSARDPIGP